LSGFRFPFGSLPAHTFRIGVLPPVLPAVPSLQSLASTLRLLHVFCYFPGRSVWCSLPIRLSINFGVFCLSFDLLPTSANQILRSLKLKTSNSINSSTSIEFCYCAGTLTANVQIFRKMLFSLCRFIITFTQITFPKLIAQHR
jgi:hypothetical protein